MVEATNTFEASPARIDYSLIGTSAASAVEKGLAEADWYQCPVPREKMRSLLERKDGPAIRDTVFWFMLLFAFGCVTVKLWGSWWAVLPYAIYATLCASVSDSRWHEAGHGTAFKTDWMNNALYEIASFMIVRESTPWRWSHTRHHSDTIIVGRDPEIAVPRPADPLQFIKTFFALPAYQKYFKHVVLHTFGRMAPEEKAYIPADQFHVVFRKARIYLAIYLSVVGLCVWTRSILPLLLIGGTNLLGSWLTVTYGMTQHAGLAENVLDHRLNCRTVYMNPLHRYLYWNMNFHVEHHMFPLVPYHALPELHEMIKDDCPVPYSSIFNAWCEIIPAVVRQIHDPAYHVRRELPASCRLVTPAPCKVNSSEQPSGWTEVCPSASLPLEDVLRFDHGRKTFAVVRDRHSHVFALDGICTHGNTRLADGFVKDGIIECPKHNGRFNLADGSPARSPVCRALNTYAVKESEGLLWVDLSTPKSGEIRKQHRNTTPWAAMCAGGRFQLHLQLESWSRGDRDWTIRRLSHQTHST